MEDCTNWCNHLHGLVYLYYSEICFYNTNWETNYNKCVYFNYCSSKRILRNIHNGSVCCMPYILQVGVWKYDALYACKYATYAWVRV